jgi:Mrp family chromosome partitioning ATPase
VPSADNSVITVNATGATPERAAARANAVAAAFQTYSAERAAQVARDTTAAAGLDVQLADQIRTRAAAYGDGVAVVENATADRATSSASPGRTAGLVALAAGLAICALLLLVRRGPAPDGSAVLSAAGTRLLGSVPVRGARRGSVSPQDHAFALVSLDYARRGTSGPVLVTGVDRNSGAASLAHGLAVSAAAQGRRVLLVDADPDSRELLLRTGAAAPARSLETLSQPGTATGDVLVPVAVSGGQFSVASIGDKNAPLDEAAARRALETVSGDYDLVLVQVAPVAKSPTAFALVGLAAVVIAAARGKDRPQAVTELRDRLQVAGRPLAGIALTGAGRWGTRPSAPASVPVSPPPAARRADPEFSTT